MLGNLTKLVHLIGRDTPTYLLDTIAALRREPALPEQTVVFYGEGGVVHSGVGKINRVRMVLGLDFLTRPPLADWIDDPSTTIVHAWSAKALSWILRSKSKLVEACHIPRVSEPAVLADASALSGIRQLPMEQLNIVCHTQTELNRLHKLGISSERCVLIRDPVDPATIEATDRTQLRRQLSLTADHSAVLILPPLERRTGAFTAAWAAMLLEHARPGVRLIVPGDGRTVEKISHMARSSNLEYILIRPANRFSLSELLNAADLAAYLPALAAPLYGINWAIAAACPIVATDTPLLRELLEHGRSAWLCAPNEPKDACRAMLQALENREQSRRQAETARAQTNAAFDRRRCLPEYCLVYKNLLADRGLDIGLDQVVLVD